MSNSNGASPVTDHLPHRSSKLLTWRRAPRLGSWRELRRLVPASGDLDLLIAAVAARRGRPIRVLACALDEEAPSGLWLQTADIDYIVHAAGIAAEHRRVVVCHELAHMLLDHGPGPGEVDTADIAPSIAPTVAARFFTRHGYEDEAEAAAESLATQLATELARCAAARHVEAALTGDTVSTRLR